MRTSLLVGAVAVVVIVGAVLFFALRPDPSDNSEVVSEEASEELETGNGQFFQEVPGDALPMSPSPATGVTSEPSPAASSTDAVTITMSESGFSPSTVTVAAGTPVTFVNNGQAAHWPASDSHPTHTVLSGFDAKRGLGTGESYSYTFTEVGTWRCHDHLMPQLTCSIVVE